MRATHAPPASLRGNLAGVVEQVRQLRANVGDHLWRDADGERGGFIERGMHAGEPESEMLIAADVIGHMDDDHERAGTVGQQFRLVVEARDLLTGSRKLPFFSQCQAQLLMIDTDDVALNLAKRSRAPSCFLTDLRELFRPGLQRNEGRCRESSPPKTRHPQTVVSTAWPTRAL